MPTTELLLWQILESKKPQALSTPNGRGESFSCFSISFLLSNEPDDPDLQASSSSLADGTHHKYALIVIVWKNFMTKWKILPGKTATRWEKREKIKFENLNFQFCYNLLFAVIMFIKNSVHSNHTNPFSRHF